jgi:5-methylcytosine-specific restriction protein A
MQIKDLSAPVTAIKLDWIAASTWMGFTPRENDLLSRNSCTRTVLNQYGRGYVLEYITISIPRPNSGYERDPDYLKGRAEHELSAGRFVAVHKIKASSRPLQEIIGEEEYSKLQNIWAKNAMRCRWSVAFPVIETYNIKDKPLAKELLGEKLFREFIMQTATLKSIDERVRACLADLQIEHVLAKNEWIAIEDEIKAAERSPIKPAVEKLIDIDLNGAFEGETEERKQKLRKRVIWLADKYVLDRIKSSKLKCDECAFDPNVVMPELINPRSLLDVHHKHPLEEGVRRTTFDDFALLCPTCHRIEHQRLKLRKAYSQGLPTIAAARNSP